MNVAIRIPQPAECGVIPLDVAKTMSGLDQLRGIMAGRLPAPPMAALIGFALVEAEEGQVVFAGTPDVRHYNPAGAVHGGYAGVLLDSCMTVSVLSTLQAGWSCVTLEYKVSLVRAMTKDTGLVRAEGKVIAVGKRTATAEGRLVDGQGRIMAHGTTTCLVFEV
jgi:uncharacterized protein (TIGR00369 family)